MPETGAPSRAFNIALWVAQAFITATFTWAACVKLGYEIPRLAAMWPWTGELPEPIVRALGLIDLAGGLGVLLPALTRIKPGLTVLAAWCCVALQVCAMLFHLSRGEAAAVPVNIVFLAVCVFIAWGRRTKAVIAPRQAR